MPAPARHRFHAAWLLAAVAVPLACPVRAQTLDGSPDTEYTLPTYSIEETALPPPGRHVPVWRYAQVDGFEVLSSGGETQTRRLVRELLRFRIALRASWPDALRHTRRPTSLILTADEHGFDAFKPFDRKKEFAAATFRFLSRPSQAAIVVDLSASVNWVPEEASIHANTSGVFAVDDYIELTRAYVRFLVGSISPEPPPWLAEGLAQLIAGIRYDSISIEYGALPAGGTMYDPTVSIVSAPVGPDGSSRLAASAAFGGRTGPTSSEGLVPRSVGMRLLPLGEMFSVQPDDPRTQFTFGGPWAASTYAFVQLCIYGERGRFQKGFFTFITRLQTEPPSEALFIECFGMNYKKFGGFLRRYTANAWYHSQRFELKRGRLPEPEPVEVRLATPAEVARIRGDALLLARGADTAFRELAHAYRDGERDPELLAALGLVEAEREKRDHARALLETATRAGVARPQPYVALARLRLDEFLARRASGDAPLSPREMADILRPLFAARQRPPAAQETYALIARTWELSATPPTRDHLAVLLEGAALFPGDSATVYRAALLHKQIGALREAGGLANLGKTCATDAAERARFVEFEDGLPAEARIDLAKAAKPSPPPAGRKSKKEKKTSGS